MIKIYINLGFSDIKVIPIETEKKWYEHDPQNFLTFFLYPTTHTGDSNRKKRK